jgi:tRNA (cmo5U34)-methyltransferase
MTRNAADGATWQSQEKVDEYLARVGGLPARIAGEGVLAEILPPAPSSLLDLGCGDGRLAGLVLAARPSITTVVAVDRSEPMLAAARARFAGDARVSVSLRDLAEPIDALGSFDVVVSGFAIHHLEHERKQALFAEIASALRPGGLFANLEVVECASEELQRRFYDAIRRPDGDPEDRLASIEPQLAWMRAAGLRNVDCVWRWRGFALLAGESAN